MWFCTTSLDQLLGSALCWRGQRSFWSLSPAGLLRSSPPGSRMLLQTATCPSDRPNQLLLSPGQTLTQHKTNHRNPMPTVSLIVHLQRHHLRIHKMALVSQEPQNVSSQRDRSPDCLLKTQTASWSHTRPSNGPGASSLRKESCCRARSRCPSSSITWCPSTGSTSTRGPSGSSVNTTVGRPGTSNRCGGL